MGGFQSDHSTSILALLFAHDRRLKTMIDRIPQQVQQRIFQLFENRSVDVNVATNHFKASHFPVALRQVPHGTHELPKQRSHRDHAYAHHFTLQVHVQALGFAMHFEDGAPMLGAKFLDHLAQSALSNHDLPGQVQHVVEFVDIGAQGAGTGPGSVSTLRRTGFSPVRRAPSLFLTASLLLARFLF